MTTEYVPMKFKILIIRVIPASITLTDFILLLDICHNGIQNY
jgi:hypothetical protein